MLEKEENERFSYEGPKVAAFLNAHTREHYQQDEKGVVPVGVWNQNEAKACPTSVAEGSFGYVTSLLCRSSRSLFAVRGRSVRKAFSVSISGQGQVPHA